MYTLDGGSAGTGLLIPPGVPKVATGPALEEVALVRDENANLVWGSSRPYHCPQGRAGAATRWLRKPWRTAGCCTRPGPWATRAPRWRTR